MTWNDLIDRLKDYSKDNPALLNEPATVDLDNDGDIQELDNLEFYSNDGEQHIDISTTVFITATC